MALLCLGGAASAQDAGIFSSPKGIGATAATGVMDGAFYTLTAFIDIYGVPTSRCLYPGVRINASRQFILGEKQCRGYVMRFYAGPGFTAGYVRDHDKGRGIDLGSLMSDNQGFMFALSGDAGCRFDFGRTVALDLSFAADAGIHFRRNEKEKTYAATNLSIFNNGIYQMLYPQFTIFFKLP